MTIKKINDIICFDFAKNDVSSVIVCGDIHGEFNEIIYKICIQYRIKDSLIIFAGDCGFGFYKYGYYENLYKKNYERLKKSNNYLLFVRGNHDNPEYFNESNVKWDRFMTVPDYSVINVCDFSILCVGGAVSIDRNKRIMIDDADREYLSSYDALKPASYWAGEMPVFNPELIDEVCNNFIIDIVVSHTSPDFCEKLGYSDLDNFIKNDSKLLDDLKSERKTMTKIYDYLKDKIQPLRAWYYGHFHSYWTGNIDGCKFYMLNINQLLEVQ